MKIETERLKKLREYEILNTPPEVPYNTIAILAAGIFDSPNAYITFIDEDSIFIKANIGDTKNINTKRNESFSSLTILQNEVIYFEDVSIMPTLKSTLNFTNSNIRFYAGAPLISPEGYKLGALSVTNNVPQSPTQKQLSMLAMLASLLMEKLELRIATRKILRAQDDRLHMMIHDLKNPITTMSLQSELIGRMPGIDDKVASIAGKINQVSRRMVDNLNETLTSARKEKGSFKPQKEKVDLKEILEKVVQSLEVAYKAKNQSIMIEIDNSIEIFGDRKKLNYLFTNLLQNAVKFSEVNTTINITSETGENVIRIAIKDNGMGLSPDDLDRLFIKFTQLSTVPTHAESSNGLGLIAVKTMVDLHKGKVWAESDGIVKGTTFFVELPIK
ncbi:HAMP domain-containing histidine kinase [Pedobacter frigidisoli]|uniref:histidine kinase n=1 Tax=Pedobacter frigidisoli TaxID=2530455 RepID=A0A4R0NEL8_9SPHI|nr:HAMP domain-containing sensor histidine kinase [Pedobacter frigidisoli]TCC98890.1 HAMP domain-containing histidine kinase [Pedobacter frigidisoli]